MIIKLTKHHLTHFGISELQLNTTNNRLFRSDIKNAKVIYISRSEGMIYTDSDYYESKHYNSYRDNDFDKNKELSFPTCFPDSIPDYYDSRLFNYLHQKNDFDFYGVEFKTRLFIIDEIKNYKLDLERHTNSIVNLRVNRYLEFNEKIEMYQTYLDYLENQYKQLDNESTEKYPTIIPQKSLSDFIKNVKNKEKFMQDLKMVFPTEKGKKIKAIIDCLTGNNVLEILEGDFVNFHIVLSEYFEREIGSRQGIIRSLHKDADKKLLDSTKEKLKPLIDKHKKQ